MFNCNWQLLVLWLAIMNQAQDSRSSFQFGLWGSCPTGQQELHLALDGLSVDDIYPIIFYNHIISSDSITRVFICLIGMLNHLYYSWDKNSITAYICTWHTRTRFDHISLQCSAQYHCSSASRLYMCRNQRKHELLSYLLIGDCEKSAITCMEEKFRAERLHTNVMLKHTNAV